MAFVFKDKFNRNIRLTDERIKHIGYNMQLNDKLYIIKETLKNPSILSMGNENNNILHFQRYLKFENIYFIITVRIFNEEGFIVTIFKSRKPKE